MKTWVVGGLVAAVSACADVRRDATRQACYDYADEISPLLATECGSCHTGAEAAAGFRVDSYAALVEPAPSGEPRVIAGDPESPLLARAAGGGGHVRAPPAAQTVLERWVVACGLSYLATDLVHPRGWVNPRDEAFHGGYLREHGWDLDGCASCHDDADPGGDRTGKGCVTCHAGGASACATCHGDAASPAPPPALDGSRDVSSAGVGAHRLHVDGGPILQISLPCSECHVVPADWRAPGHIFDADGALDPDPRAEVVFGARAGLSLTGFEAWRTAPPVYDPTSGSCRNVYCHGGALADGRDPVWTAGATGANGCDTCHRSPPATTHAGAITGAQCQRCHSAVVDGTPQITSAALHLDGALSLDANARTCSGCHGSAANAAPPASLDGSTATTVLAVGAHQTHVAASHFSGPLACRACHRQPEGTTFEAAVGAAGHLDDSPGAEVFPGGASFTGLAAGRGAAPTFDRGTGACSGVYCHGGGALLADDASAGVVRVLSWTDVGNDKVGCGSCHGLPPTTGAGHLPSTSRADCNLCHALVVDGAGELRFDGEGRTLHLNGHVDYNQ